MLNIERMRELCNQYWNPIGIPMAGLPGSECTIKPLPADEYDVYLERVAYMAEHDHSENEIADYLTIVEKDYMGFGDSGEIKDFIRNVLTETLSGKKP